MSSSSNTTTCTWVNGKPISTVPITDRGLLYGDGLFETIKVVDRQITLENLHWQRLSSGAARLSIPIDIDQIKRESLELLETTSTKNAILKVIITRGCGGRGYNPVNCVDPSRILTLHPLPSYPESLSRTGIETRICDLRLGYSYLAGIKHLNRLEQILARSEWTDSDCYEGLLLDGDDFIIEGTMTNIFLVDEHECLQTPKLDRCGVAGVCRQYILDKARSWGLVFKEEQLSLTALSAAKEVFVCNSINGIWPVVSCGSLNWPIGAVTQIIRDKMMEVLNG